MPTTLPPPRPLHYRDFVVLTDKITAGVAKAAAEAREPQDFQELVFRAALEAVYGPDFWNWWDREVAQDHDDEYIL